MLQAKHKCKEKASAYASYLPAQLVKSYRSEVLSKFDPEVQELASSIEQRENIPLYPDKIEMKDMNNAKLEWLLDIDDLTLFSEQKNFVADIDEISVSVFSAKSFC